MIKTGMCEALLRGQRFLNIVDPLDIVSNCYLDAKSRDLQYLLRDQGFLSTVDHFGRGI